MWETTIASATAKGTLLGRPIDGRLLPGLTVGRGPAHQPAAPAAERDDTALVGAHPRDGGTLERWIGDPAPDLPIGRGPDLGLDGLALAAAALI